MSWEDQGRQAHGWFGHGTAVESQPEPIFEPAGLERRIDTVAHGAQMHLPRKDWHRSAIAFDGRRLEQIRRAMLAWVAARGFDDATFAARFADPRASDAAIQVLRAAADATRTATTHQGLMAASAQFAAGMLVVGLDRWPG